MVARAFFVALAHRCGDHVDECWTEDKTGTDLEVWSATHLQKERQIVGKTAGEELSTGEHSLSMACRCSSVGDALPAPFLGAPQTQQDAPRASREVQRVSQQQTSRVGWWYKFKRALRGRNSCGYEQNAPERAGRLLSCSWAS